MTPSEFITIIRGLNFTFHAESGFYLGMGYDLHLYKFAEYMNNICCFKKDLILFQVPRNISVNTFEQLLIDCQIMENNNFNTEEVLEDEEVDGLDDVDEGYYIDDDDDIELPTTSHLKKSKFIKLLNDNYKKKL